MGSLGDAATIESGNLRSRWTDFLTTDGEKPDRFREREAGSAMDT